MDETDLLALLSGEDPSAQEKAAAMAQALRRQRAAGNLGLLTGDRVLGGFGQAQLQGAQAGEALQERRADRSGDARARMLQLALGERRAQAAADEQVRDNARAERGQMLQAQILKQTLGMRSRADERAEAAEARAAEKAAQEAADKAKGKDLPATTVEGLADLPTALSQIDALAKDFDRLDMGSSASKASATVTRALGLQGTDAAEFEAINSRAKQAAGKILEGGKMTEGDEQKYTRMFLRPGDSKEVVKAKTEGMKKFLIDLSTSRAKGLKDSGYNVPAQFLSPAMPKETPMIQARPRVMYRADGTAVEVED